MSHHLSGPRSLTQPIADITDLYAFPIIAVICLIIGAKLIGDAITALATH